MNEQLLRQHLEEIDPDGEISQAKIEELVSSFKDIQKKEPIDSDKGYLANEKSLTYNLLRDRLEKETDWREKAKIAAQMVINNLE